MSATPPRKWKFSRRKLLIGLGVTGGALAVGLPLSLPFARLKIAGMLDSASAPAGTMPKDPFVWFEVTPQNRVRLYLPKAEMGQGVHTALAQIAAEELRPAWEQLEVLNASTARGFDMGTMSVGGSVVVSSLYNPLRAAGAALRLMLQEEGARQLGVAPEQLTVAGGVVAATADPSKALTFGQIVSAKQGAWVASKQEPQLREPAQFEFIGKPMPRVDFAAKITGAAQYGLDMRLPNMAYGAVARAPRIGAKLLSAAPGTARSQPGVVAVVATTEFAGVAAETRAQAIAALDALQLEWSEGDVVEQAAMEALVTVQPGAGTVLQSAGSVAAPLAAANALRAEYRTPFAAHAQLEPQAALAHVLPDKVLVWCSTQSPGSLRADVAKAVGRKAAEVEVTATYLGGSFGRKLNVDVALDAARLSAAALRPVAVSYTRAEEFQHGFFRPPTQHVLQGALDGAGRIVAMSHAQASGNVFPALVGRLLGADFGAYRGGLLRYNIPNRQVTSQPVALPVPTGFWRGLGLLANVFAVESFMDELALSAGVDALQFRLQHLPQDKLGERFRAVLLAAAERAGWGTALPAGRARGLACSWDAGTVVAQVAEVSVQGARVQVQRFTSAVDCGVLVNPDIAAAQTEGSIMMGLSSTLLEEITFSGGQAQATNFDRYPLLRLADAPLVETVFLQGDDVPHGMGEPPLGPVAAAVANAVFALTGQRLRSLPLKLA